MLDYILQPQLYPTCTRSLPRRADPYYTPLVDNKEVWDNRLGLALLQMQLESTSSAATAPGLAHRARCGLSDLAKRAHAVSRSAVVYFKSPVTPLASSRHDLFIHL